MDITATELRFGNNDATAQNDLARPNTIELIESEMIDALDVEAVNLNPILPNDGKWAIRFKAGATVTIVLGMRNYGRGWYSGHFAGLVVARLGIPFRRVRIYYSGNLPAVLETPVPRRAPFSRGEICPVAGAAADIIEAMCDQVIEKGRIAFATMANVGADDVGFDQSTGRFFVLDRERSGSLFELAKVVPGEFSISTELAKKLRRSDRRSIAEEIQVPSAA